mmetsp:Transcript_12309/g.37041  ORF Transcript_12309/g.37041 Transcript_12309/m.37041 type:complete len:252 (-) Transcript_12309:2020-2775(-)
MNLVRSSAFVRWRNLTATSWTPARTALYTDPNWPAPRQMDLPSMLERQICTSSGLMSHPLTNRSVRPMVAILCAEVSSPTTLVRPPLMPPPPNSSGLEVVLYPTHASAIFSTSGSTIFTPLGAASAAAPASGAPPAPDVRPRGVTITAVPALLLRLRLSRPVLLWGAGWEEGVVVVVRVLLRDRRLSVHLVPRRLATSQQPRHTTRPRMMLSATMPAATMPMMAPVDRGLLSALVPLILMPWVASCPCTVS